jgi:ATP-dependent DNA ligase
VRSPKRSRSILSAQHVRGRGGDVFATACSHDLEGIVAKHRAGRYGENEPTRWLGIKNPEYSHARDRAELFER